MKILVLPGDGIGPEIVASALEVLAVCDARFGLGFEYTTEDIGFASLAKHGTTLREEVLQGARAYDGIILGTQSHADYPAPEKGGRNISAAFRVGLDLYANVRPIRLYPGAESPLKHWQPGQIDYVIVRENTEGLYASRGGGIVLRGEVATDTIVVTRKGIERVARFSFELARKRNGAPRDGKRRVTVCDKANILRTYAFFRSVCDEVAQAYPDVEIDYAYADAITVHMLKRPDFYDVIVAENMFGDIISDLGAATIGGMGLSASAELGDHHGLFQGAHGSAPDIAGKNIASPLATILSGALMLRWLGDRHSDSNLTDAALRVEAAVEKVLALRECVPGDLGGRALCTEMTDAVIRAL